jgi:Tol biopolymer transport system component/DNA-binding winged helix-turn-helix (wHTH) protein
MDSNDVRYYEFGDFRLDTRRRTLLKNHEPVNLSGRIYDLLLVMVQNEGRILEHDELLDKVWEGMFVEQSNLKKSVSALRHILGEQPNESLYVKTIPRRGYSFVSPVRAIREESGPATYRQIEREIIVEEEVEIDDAQPDVKRLVSTRTNTFQRVVLIGGVIVLVLSAVGFGAWTYLAKRPMRFSAENVRITRLTTEGNAGNPVVSSDGNYIVYSSVDEKGAHLRIKQLLTGKTNLLYSLPKASYWASAFSPDGNFVYFFSKNWQDPDLSGLYKVSFLGGEAKRISTSVGGGLVISPDGKILAMARDNEKREPEIIVMDDEGGNERRVAGYVEQVRIWSLSFSPDGSSLLTAFRKQLAGEKTQFYLSEVSVADGAEKSIIPDNPTLIQQAIWVPDKQSILLTVRQSNADITQVWQYFPGGEMRRVTNDDYSYRTLKISKDGKSIFSTVETRIAGVWTSDDDSKDFRLITNGVQLLDRVLWTNDGRLVICGIESGAESIWVTAADGSGKKQLTDGKDNIWLQPTISGDGRSVVFTSSRSGTPQIWRVGIDGQNLTQLTHSDTIIALGRLLADNQTLFYQKYIKPQGWLIVRQAADGTVEPVTDVEVDNWSVSPDERSLAFSATEPKTGKSMIYIRSLETGSMIASFTGAPDRSLGWTRDSKSLVYDVGKNGASELFLQPVAGGEVKAITDFRNDSIFWFDWSYDGRKLAVVRGKQPTDVVMIKEEN